ncbi:glutamate receptor ionotropic, kainate 2-like isoform X1 [Daphnia carinata]|uniref:glutamate receptor ionotropic, kainate 2-like isoform X1 n=1 Tax=Daphnia carinata TaxID=120202 RepID=UPI00286937C7|nr:glutamate receptor ionotropic, kainate 2-like isoform X1 [Daphnia carinata]
MASTMLKLFKLIILFVVIFGDRSQTSLATVPNALKGQHLRIIWPRWEGNPKGLSGPLKGGVIIDYLAARLGFTYEMVRITENRLEPAPNQRGLFNYLWDGKCDFLVTAVVPTWERNKVVDLTLPWDYTTLTFLIPVHTDTANIKSVVKPFQWPLWVGLIVTAVCVIVVLSLIQRCLEYMERRPLPETKAATETCTNLPKNTSRLNGGAGKQSLYVLGNLLSQGGPCASNRLPFRLVAGVWTLGAFIFVQAYTSILFTYVVAPVSLPLINSIYDIADSDDINLLMKKAGTPEGMFMNNNWTGFYEKIRIRVNSFPDSRCVLVSDCIKFISPGSRNVFVDGAPYQLDAIKEDFEKTGKCNLQLARNSYSTLPLAMALPKHSPYTNPISKGFLELQERGLINYWDLWFRPMPVQCTENFKFSGLQSSRRENHPPLSLKNLTGAFLVLLVGISLAFLAFLCEQIISMPRGRRPCRRI